MSVGLLLITHGNIGCDLAETARATFGSQPLPIAQLAVPLSGNPDMLLERARSMCEHLDQGDGVLVITDMFGSTPSNIACRLNELPRIRIIAGLNLPMLIRVLNYPDLPLEGLAEKALSGGHDGVLDCQQSQAR